MKKVLSLYSGAGGLDLGFHESGYEIVLSTDIWDLAIKSLKENIAPQKAIVGDIREIDFRNEVGKVDVVIGGPPCPPFSKSRFYLKDKPRAMEDNGGFTVKEYFRAVEETNPQAFIFENVHGFVYKPHQDALEYLSKRASDLGYSISHNVVNAADYGIPQTRERFICVGLKKELGSFQYPVPTHSKIPSASTKRWVTAGDVLLEIDFPLPEDEEKLAGSKHKELLPLIPPGDNYLFFTKERGHPDPIFKWRSRYWSFLLKLSPDRPSWTIQASHSNNMGPFHWNNRFLRIQEILRLQSFPKDYKLFGSYSDQWRQVGNAVPPKLSKVFADAILPYLR